MLRELIPGKNARRESDRERERERERGGGGGTVGVTGISSVVYDGAV